MRIGLVDVDGHNFPNIALMKLSAWHKRRGDTVEFADPAVRRYDKVYMSKVFTFSRDCTDRYDCEVVRAGTGYRDYATMLPEEIEHICPDYSLYGVPEKPATCGPLSSEATWYSISTGLYLVSGAGLLSISPLPPDAAL